MRFALVGIVVAATYVALYLLFMAVGLTQSLSNAGAFLLAVALQYVGQAGFTFGAKLSDAPQATRFGLMICCGLITSALITGVFGPGIGLPNWLSAVVVTVVLPFQNYLIMTRWVFLTPGKRVDATQ
ncbi:GtrA family protein [Sulfitobacter sp. JB4-11]|uniref:GtrA family protein n=1 Tax=Sulfitobacter rhodophyticola TaxID=3238304 RepID=UPI003516D407